MRRLMVIALLFAFPLYAQDLGVFGSTYQVAEKDLITEIENRAAEVDWQAKFNEEAGKVRKNAAIADMLLPPAEKDRSYFVDMTYSLENDIPRVDTNGKIIGVLYKKGLTYNPLDYADITETYVILNATRQEELAWFKKYYSDNYQAYPIITEGDAFLAAETLGRAVFKLDNKFRNRFLITNTISVIYEDFSHKMMRVDVVKVEDEKIAGDTAASGSK